MIKKKKFLVLLLTIVLSFCLCLIVSGCADTVSDKTNQTEAADMITLNNWQFTSGVPNNAITVHSDNKNFIFVCNADNGQFWNYKDQKFDKSVELNSEETTWWIDNPATENDFIVITVKENDNIIGYAVIAVYKTEVYYSAEVIESVLFSEIKTFEQVNAIVENIKENYNIDR